MRILIFSPNKILEIKVYKKVVPYKEWEDKTVSFVNLLNTREIINFKLL